MHWLRELQHWLSVHTGTASEGTPWYSFWSGFGSDLAYLGVFGGLLRHVNCGVKGCWRLGRHVTGEGHRVCAIHHPAGPPQ